MVHDRVTLITDDSGISAGRGVGGCLGRHGDERRVGPQRGVGGVRQELVFPESRQLTARSIETAVALAVLISRFV